MHPVADLNTDSGAPMMVVIGCGNLNRSDDAVGVCVIHRLRAEFGSALPPGVKLFDAGTAGMEVMFQARGASSLLIVDACRSGSDPGAVFCLPGSEINTAHQPGYTLHDFRWDHAVYAGRRIFGDAFPSDVTVFLVEAESLELGTELSETVACAADKVCDLVAARIRAWRAGLAAAPAELRQPVV
jgi:hydrogenase maturation protease